MCDTKNIKIKIANKTEDRKNSEEIVFEFYRHSSQETLSERSLIECNLGEGRVDSCSSRLLRPIYTISLRNQIATELMFTQVTITIIARVIDKLISNKILSMIPRLQVLDRVSVETYKSGSLILATKRSTIDCFFVRA